MKRRSRAGGKTSKARGRKALKPKRRDAPNAVSSYAPVQDAEVARLTRELNKACEQVIKKAIFKILPDIAEVEQLFLIIKAQKEY